MALEFKPEDHFDISLESAAGRPKLKVEDTGTEDRAVLLLELAYRTAFLNQPYSETIRSGFRSFFEKKWTQHGKAGIAKKCVEYGTAGVAFAVLTAATGPTVLGVLAVGAGALAIKKGLSWGIDKKGVKNVFKRLKKSGDPELDASLTAQQKQQEQQNWPKAALPIMLEHGGVTSVVERLASHWRDIKHFKYHPDYGGKDPAKKDPKKCKPEDDALAFFQSQGRTEAWREWYGGDPGENYLDASEKLTDASSPKKSRKRGAKRAKAAKNQQNTYTKTSDHNFMRLKIKKLTFYSACLMDYCRHFQAEHARVHGAIKDGWEDLTRLVLKQCHVCSPHEECPDDPPCFGGFGLLRQRARDLGYESLLDQLDVQEIETAAPTGRLSEAHFAEREQAIQATSKAAKFIRGKLKYDTAGRKTQEKALEQGTKRAVKGTAEAVKTGDPSKILSALRSPTARAVDKAKQAGGLTFEQIVIKGNMPSPKAILSAPADAPVMPCAGEIAADITTLFFSHYRQNVGAREHLADLTREIEQADTTLTAGNRVVAAAMEAMQRQNPDWFIDQLPSNDDLKSKVSDELVAAANKIEHYVLKSDRRRAQFVELYEEIGGRRAPGCTDCNEAYELSYRFFNMLKTMWKLEQHIMFLSIFAKGICAALAREASTYHFPHEAAGGLDKWFEFWHHVQSPNPARARLTFRSGSSSLTSSLLTSSSEHSPASSLVVYFSSSTGQPERIPLAESTSFETSTLSSSLFSSDESEAPAAPPADTQPAPDAAEEESSSDLASDLSSSSDGWSIESSESGDGPA